MDACALTQCCLFLSVPPLRALLCFRCAELTTPLAISLRAKECNAVLSSVYDTSAQPITVAGTDLLASGAAALPTLAYALYAGATCGDGTAAVGTVTAAAPAGASTTEQVFSYDGHLVDGSLTTEYLLCINTSTTTTKIYYDTGVKVKFDHQCIATVNQGADVVSGAAPGPIQVRLVFVCFRVFVFSCVRACLCE